MFEWSCLKNKIPAMPIKYRPQKTSATLASLVIREIIKPASDRMITIIRAIRIKGSISTILHTF
jgi:hypothetical protein